MGSYETRTDSNGAFVFEGTDIPEGSGPRLIWATGAGGASILRELRSDDSKFEVVLQHCGRIEGVVDGQCVGMIRSVATGYFRGAWSFATLSAASCFALSSA
jgi:hypothetical protein